MKVEIKNNQSVQSTFVEIHCKEITKEVSRLKTYIDNFRTGGTTGFQRFLSVLKIGDHQP